MMGVLSRIEDRASPENPSTSLSSPDGWLFDAFGAGRSDAGANVNEQSAMRASAVFACVRVLAESIASLPLPVYERLSGGGKRRATEHGLYRILHDQPNADMTAVSYRETMVGHVALWGNHYSWIEMDNATRVRALWPLLPDRTYARRVNGRKAIVTRVDGREVVLPGDEVLHVPGLGFDGLTGHSPIQMGRQAIGLSLATEEFGARWFGNGSRLSGVLQHPGRLSPDAHRQLRSSWHEAHTGLSNAHRAAILEEGMTWQQIGVPPDDAQFLETRKFQTAEIARMFRVPLHMIGDLERSTNNNIEHQSIEFVVYTLRPWLVRIEQALNSSVFGARERQHYFAEHLIEGLLRGDIKSRSEALAIQRQNGVINADEWRELENLNAQAGGQGRTYWMPRNMAPADRMADVIDAEIGGKTLQPPGQPDRPVAAPAFIPLLEAAALRCVRRETQAVGARARAMLTEGMHDEFRDWAVTWYAAHREYVAHQMMPVIRVMGSVLGVHDAEERAAAALAGLSAASWVDGLDVQRVDGAVARVEDTLPAATALAVVAALTRGGVEK